MSFIITAVQAAKFAHRANIAAQQARAAGCLVEIDLSDLRIFPTAPQYQVEIGLLAHEDLELVDPGRANTVSN